MQARSALFDQTVAGPHTMIVRADILSQGQPIATGLPISSGSVTGNRTQFSRRTCTAVIPDPAYTPKGVKGDLIAPYGNEIRLWRGALTPVGPELICVGTFGMRDVDFDDGGAFNGITITGIDRCKLISETRFPFPRTTPSFDGALNLIRTLILEVFPWVEVRIDPECWDVTVPSVTWSQARDTAIVDLAASIGCEVYCDPFGAFVVQPIPSPTDTPVFTVTGGQGGILLAARHGLSRDSVYNGVVARGSTTSTTVAAPTSDLIVDSDPTSPTYWGGPFGQIVGYYDSSLIVDYEQANNAALAMLLNNIGAARSITYTTAVNPAIEPGDVVAVVDPITGVTEQHMHDTLTIPLDAAGTMTAQTRSTLAVVKHPRRRTIQLYGGALS